ncbi:MAG TPA: endolytic transglycosylase MltG [Candidatus Paceibacterota bacterium]|nr:endolytic transglycosylase MltG [Candidatus Paceibacterota bacterium]
MDISDKEPIKTYTRRSRVYVLIAMIVFIIGYYSLISAPIGSNPTTIHISPKESLHAISNDLKDKNIIRSKTLLQLLAELFKSDRQIPWGDYYFNKNSPLFKVAWDLAHGMHNVNPIKITIREGLTNGEISDLLSKNIAGFNKEEFDKNAAAKQGYLFPDTYFFFSLSTTDEIISVLSDNFDKQTAKLRQDVLNSKHSLNDIITMASILEHEASSESDMKIISGILWKRLSLGMPLQVDAAPITYKILGLPSEPIANPGLMSISASLYPVDSPYLYYLYDKNGMIHFAKTFQEHKINIAKYLK